MKKGNAQLELTEVIVPFDKKKDARDSKLIFNKNDRKWYGTKETIEIYNTAINPMEQKEPDLKCPVNDESSTEQVPSDKTEAEVLNAENIISEEQIPETSLEKEKDTPDKLNIDQQAWDSILEEKNTLKIALYIQKYGLPDLENERITMLKILGKRHPGEYPITYDGLINMSDEFNQKYSEEYVQDLLRQCITGQRNYIDEVRDSMLSEEEKALLFFVLPI